MPEGGVTQPAPPHLPHRIIRTMSEAEVVTEAAAEATMDATDGMVDILQAEAVTAAPAEPALADLTTAVAEASAVSVEAVADAAAPAAAAEASAEPEVPSLPVIDDDTFVETASALYSEVDSAMNELIEGGYDEYASQIGVWLKGLKQSYGDEFAGWPGALEKESRKPKAPPAICALRPQLHDAARKLKEVLLVRWATSATEAKPAVVAARKRTAKALADANAAKLKPVEKPPRKRAKSGVKALEGPAVLPADALLAAPPSDMPHSSSDAPPLVAPVASGGDIPVAVATVAAPLIDSTTTLITAMATVDAGGGAGAQQAPAGAPVGAETSPVMAAAVECDAAESMLGGALPGDSAVSHPPPVSLSEAAVSLSDVVDAADADCASVPIDAVSDAIDGTGEAADSADGNQVASWVVAS